MAIGFEAFDLSGSITIELGDSETTLLRINRGAKNTEKEFERLQKQVLTTAAAFKRLNDTQNQRASASVARDLQATRDSLKNLAPDQAIAQITKARNKVSELNAELLRTRTLQADSAKKTNNFAAGFADRLGVGGVALGTLAGGLAAGAVIAIANEFKQLAAAIASTGAESVKTAAAYERTRNALSAIAGSSAIARNELASLERLARNTPGLGLEAAEGGLLRLRAVGFEAKQVEDTLVGLSRVKILSGGTKQDLEAVLYNLTQIKSTGKLTGDELRETLGRLPAIAPVIERAFGTISTEKIKELNLSSDEFFRRFNAALKEVPPIAGGASDAWEKFTDELLKAQRDFGTPLLEPLANSLQDLTAFLRENRDAWSEWGGAAGEAITGATALIKQLNALATPKASPEQTVPRSEQITRELVKNALIPGYLPFRILQGLGKQAAEPKDINQGESVFVVDPKKQKAKDDEQVRNYKQTFDRLEQARQNDLRRVENYYTQQANLASAGLRITTEQELAYQKRVSSLRDAEATARLSVLAKEIDAARALNEKLIATFKPEDQNRIRQTKHLELVEKEIALEQERIKVQGNRISQQNVILELEKRVADERRAALIEFTRLQAAEAAQFAETRAFDLRNAIESGLVASEAGFDELISLTQSSYQTISRLTIESYQTQLQDLALTKEQRQNLTTQMYLDERRLAEETSRKIVEIEQERFQKAADLIRNQSEQIQKSLQSRGRLFEQFRTSFFQADISFGEGFKVGGGIFDLQTELNLDTQRNAVLEGRTSIYEVQQSVLDKTHKAEHANLQREIDLTNDLIQLEEIRLKAILRTNVANSQSRADQLKVQRERQLSQGIDTTGIDAEILAVQNQTEAWRRTLEQGGKELSEYFAANSPAIKKLTGDVKNLTDAQKELNATQAVQNQELFAASTTGLKQFYDALKSGQRDAVVAQIAENQLWRERTDLATEYLFVQERINKLKAGDKATAGLIDDRVRLQLAREEEDRLVDVEVLRKRLAELNDPAKQAEFIKQLQDRNKLEREYAEALERSNRQARANEAGGSNLAAGLFAGLGIEKFESDADAMASTMERLGQIGANAFNGLADAMGSVIENWVLYGSAAEGGAQKAVAAALAAAASQSAVSAIMETAYGIAALTPWGALIYGPAPFHFKSAALFATVAAGTALAGRAVAGNSFQNQGGGSSNAGQPDFHTSPPVQQQQNNRPITPEAVTTQQGKGVIEMVNQLKTVVQQMAVSVQKHGEAIETNSQMTSEVFGRMQGISKGQILELGAKENPGFFSKQTVAELRNGDQQKLNDLRRVLGG